FCKKIVNVSDDVYQKSGFSNRLFCSHKNIVINNGINIPTNFSDGKSPGSIIMVGRLNPVKNHLLAFQAIKKAKATGTDVSLKVVGGGALQAELQTQINKMGLNDCIKLLGDRNDVSSLLVDADIFLMTSLSEGHSIALLEACAAGLPAVVSNVGGNKDIIKNNFNGFVCDLDDIDSFPSSILELCLNRKLWKKYSTNTRNWASQNASISKCADLYSAAYGFM
ncbi:MAG: glycosyltransferase, partial [Opitutales bacterium]|nr:glycosyltransferase [Opitutales bacterium]